MEIVRYLTEFFFCNFWHWLALAVLLAVVFVRPSVRVNRFYEATPDADDDEEGDEK